jgi:hypothetical protein
MATACSTGKRKMWLHPGHLIFLPAGMAVLVLSDFWQLGQENLGMAHSW